jgi:hypothetical protein
MSGGKRTPVPPSTNGTGAVDTTPEQANPRKPKPALKPAQQPKRARKRRPPFVL